MTENSPDQCCSRDCLWEKSTNAEKKWDMPVGECSMLDTIQRNTKKEKERIRKKKIKDSHGLR